MTETQERAAPAKRTTLPDHSAEAQRLSQDTTGVELAHPFGFPPGLPRSNHAGTGTEWADYPPVLTPKHLSPLLDVSYNTLLAELDHGSLAPIAVRIGKQYRVSREALRRFIEDTS